MLAAGYIRKDFISDNLFILRDGRTYKEFADDIKRRGNFEISPWLLERYENDHIEPDTIILERIAVSQGQTLDFFYYTNIKNIIQRIDINRIKANTCDLLDDKIIKWLTDSENFDLIKRLYESERK
jgi:hypothetical protein